MADNNQKTDEELVVRVQAGDDEFFDVLMDRYREKLSHYVMRFAESVDESHDILQEAFIKAHRGINTFDTTKKFSPWIYRVVHNTAVTHVTKRNKKKTISIDGDESLSSKDQLAIADVETASLDSWFKQELRQEMREAIAQLPPQYAEAIHLRYIEDLSYKEMSHKLGKPVNTIGTLVRRAKKQLLKVVLDSDKL